MSHRLSLSHRLILSHRFEFDDYILRSRKRTQVLQKNKSTPFKISTPKLFAAISNDGGFEERTVLQLKMVFVIIKKNRTRLMRSLQ